jgi:hypothetical protein
VKVVTLGSEEFLQLEAARRGKRRLIVETKSGDTLAKLGRRYGLTVGDLARINRFSYNTELHEGQKVVVYSPVGEPSHDVAQGLAMPLRRERGAHDNVRVSAAGAGATKVVAKADAKLAGKNEPRGEGKAAAKVATKTNESSTKRAGAEKGARVEVKVDKATSPPKFVPKKK